MHDVGGRAVPEGEYAYVTISGKARVPVLHPLKICANSKSTAQLAYIVTDTDSDCGRYF